MSAQGSIAAAVCLGRAAADQTARYMEYHWTPEPYLAQTYSRMDR